MKESLRATNSPFRYLPVESHRNVEGIDDQRTVVAELLLESRVAVVRVRAVDGDGRGSAAVALDRGLGDDETNGSLRPVENIGGGAVEAAEGRTQVARKKLLDPGQGSNRRPVPERNLRLSGIPFSVDPWEMSPHRTGQRFRQTRDQEADNLMSGVQNAGDDRLVATEAFAGCRLAPVDLLPEVHMDPVIGSLILFAGLILVASVMTGLVVTSAPGSARSLPVVEKASSLSEAAVPVSIFCPKTDTPANVGLGIDGGGPAPELTVLQCQRFPQGPVTCDMECLTASIAA